MTQKFIVRPVRPALNDSLYYFIQDGDYRLLAKDKNSAWSTTFSILPTDETIWKVIPMNNNIIAIENFVTKMALGSDAVTINSWLWDDKTFVSGPNSAPYCEWMLVNLDGSALKNVPEGNLEVIAKDGFVKMIGLKIGEQLSVYDLFGRLVQTRTTEASSLTLNLKSGLFLIQIGNKTVKVLL